MNAAVVALTVALLVDVTHAVVLCAKPKKDGTYSTSIKIREACKLGETQLDPGSLGLQGPPGSPGLFVVDANNTVVGTVLALADPWLTTANEMFSILTYNTPPPYVTDGFRSLLIVRSINGSPAAFMVTRDEVRSPHPGGVVLFFESTDCSGAPMIGSDHTVLISYGLVRNGTAYARRLGAAPILAASLLSWDTSELDCAAAGGTFHTATGECCMPRSGGDFATPADTAPLPTFVPPFHTEG